jgi:hypothetical protein
LKHPFYWAGITHSGIGAIIKPEKDKKSSWVILIVLYTFLGAYFLFKAVQPK